MRLFAIFVVSLWITFQLGTSAYAFGCSTPPNCGNPVEKLTCPVCCPRPCPDLDGDFLGGIGDVLTALADFNELTDLIKTVEDLQQKTLGGAKLSADIYQTPPSDYYLGRIVSTGEITPSNPYITANPEDTAGVIKDIKTELFLQEDRTLSAQTKLHDKRQEVMARTATETYAMSFNTLAAMSSFDLVEEGISEYMEIARAMDDQEASIKAMSWANIQLYKAIYALLMRRGMVLGTVQQLESMKILTGLPLALDEAVANAETTSVKISPDYAQLVKDIAAFKDKIKEKFTVQYPGGARTTSARDIQRLHTVRQSVNFDLNEIAYNKTGVACHDQQVSKVDKLAAQLARHISLKDSVARPKSGPIFATATEERYSQIPNPFGDWLRSFDKTTYEDGQLVRMTQAVRTGCRVYNLMEECQTGTPFCFDESVGSGRRNVFAIHDEGRCVTQYNFSRPTESGGGVANWLEADKIEKYMFELRTGFDFKTGEDTGNGFEDLIVQYQDDLQTLTQEKWMNQRRHKVATMSLKTRQGWNRSRKLLRVNAGYLKDESQGFLRSAELADLQARNQALGGVARASLEGIVKELQNYIQFANAVAKPKYEFCPVQFRPPSLVKDVQAAYKYKVDEQCIAPEETTFDCIFY